MKKHLCILHVEDRESDASLIQRVLEKAGHTVSSERVEDAAQLRAALTRQPWDVIICDYALPQFNAPAALKVLQESGLDIPFIVVSGAIGEDVAVEMMKSGAHDYLMKDNLARLPAAVTREIGEARLRLESRQMQDAIRQREALLRAVCDNTADYIVLKDLAGRIVLANPAALRALGKPADQVIGQTDSSLFTDTGIAAAIEGNDRRVIEQGTVRIVEEVIEAPGGKRTYISTKTPWRDGNGRVVGVVAISHDITERKIAQEELLRSEQRERARANELQAIMDTLPLAAFISRDPECREIIGNRKAYEVLRLPAGTDLSKSGLSPGVAGLRVIRDGVDVAPEDMPMQVAARTLRPVDNYSCEFLLADGTRHHMLGFAVPLSDGNGRPRGSVAAFTDVTEMKQLEERLREAHRLEGIGLIAGGIAHDFNNILTGVTGNASMALGELCQECHVASFLRNCVDSALRAAGLTRQLLAYAGQGAETKDLVSASETGQAAAQQLRAVTPKNVDIQTNLGAQLPPVMMDPAQMHQIFTSLILNGVEAIGEGKEGVVKVATDLRDDFVRIVVSDSGSGMDEAVKRRMFEPFFTTKFIGRGLGLAAVEGIVRTVGGRIAAESQIGRGTSVEVYLPVSKTIPASNPPVRQGLPRLGRATGAVLVVDDEPSILELTTAFLRKHAIPYFEASDGLEALEHLKTHGSSIRAVLLDVTMPGIRGDEVLPSILELQPDVQVIISSGYSQADLSRQFSGYKVRTFLTKPYTGRQLLEHVFPALGIETPA